MPFTNRNICRTFNINLNNTSIKQLSSQECSEVMFSCTGDDLKIYERSNPSAYFVIPKNTVVTIKGVTNSAELSAITLTGSHTIGYRTQYYSGLQQTFV